MLKLGGGLGHNGAFRLIKADAVGGLFVEVLLGLTGGIALCNALEGIHDLGTAQKSTAYVNQRAGLLAVADGNGGILMGKGRDSAKE